LTFALGALGFASGCAAPALPAPVPPAQTARASSLPAIALTTLDGKSERLESVLAGRPALVSLWATWCAACASEQPALDRLRAQAEKLGAAVVSVAVGEPHDKVAAQVRWRGLAGAQLVDEQFQFADALGQRRVPATLVVDRAGRITFVGGALDAPALAALRAALDARIAHR
jgi:thiol-disulfide isomerase/thioredoxin